MSQLGSVGVGLSVAFALFMLVLAVELYYVWTNRQKRREADTPVKQVQWSSTWRHMVAVSWNVLGAEEIKRWAKLGRHSAAQAGGAGMVEEGLEAAEGKTAADGKKQEDEDEEEDVFRVGGLLGPPRLLFTIKEETKEELELEEMRSAGAGKGSHRASRASGDFLFEASACTSPFVTPPSSPPFATPFGSPAPPLPLPSCKLTQDVESSSSSTSSFPHLWAAVLSLLFLKKPLLFHRPRPWKHLQLSPLLLLCPPPPAPSNGNAIHYPSSWIPLLHHPRLSIIITIGCIHSHLRLLLTTICTFMAIPSASLWSVLCCPLPSICRPAYHPLPFSGITEWQEHGISHFKHIGQDITLIGYTVKCTASQNGAGSKLEQLKLPTAHTNTDLERIA